MSLRTLPEARSFPRPQNYQWDAPSDVVSLWAESPRAAADNQSEATISILDIIGEDFWTGGGFTAKRAAAALRAIGDRDVIVQMNSPGGDLFEGIAIYNLLRAHKAKVTVQVLGWAASAASIIAMAGDEIVMGLGTFMMVHNAWGAVVGNQHDFSEATQLFKSFDSAIADIYEARTGADRKKIEALMDADTFMSPSEAVKNGFADRVDDSLKLDGEAKASIEDPVMARRKVEAALAKQGYSRNQRSELISGLVGARRDASPSAARDAGGNDTLFAEFKKLFSI